MVGDNRRERTSATCLTFDDVWQGRGEEDG